MSSSIRSFRSLVATSFGIAALSTTAHAEFVINPTYDSTILGNPAIKNTLDSAISFYESTFTDNITVNITFNSMTTGLGQSSDTGGIVTYATFHNALIADATSADDAAALAQLAANPASGNIIASKANLRALGFDVSNIGNPDSTIGLNTGACFYGHANPIQGKFDLYAVACHEIDEALGTPSGVGGANKWAADLYRYDAFGNRSFNTDNGNGNHVYFSIDGTTHIVEYNQAGRTVGDWGDWVVHSPAQVQDWGATAGVLIDPNNQLRVLDVVGYNRASVPEPASIAVLGLGLAAVVRRGKRKPETLASTSRQA